MSNCVMGDIHTEPIIIPEWGLAIVWWVIGCKGTQVTSIHMVVFFVILGGEFAINYYKHNDVIMLWSWLQLAASMPLTQMTLYITTTYSVQSSFFTCNPHWRDWFAIVS